MSFSRLCPQRIKLIFLCLMLQSILALCRDNLRRVQNRATEKKRSLRKTDGCSIFPLVRLDIPCCLGEVNSASCSRLIGKVNNTCFIRDAVDSYLKYGNWRSALSVFFSGPIFKILDTELWLSGE